MDESKVEELVTRVLRGLEVFDLFLLLSATAFFDWMKRRTWSVKLSHLAVLALFLLM